MLGAAAALLLLLLPFCCCCHCRCFTAQPATCPGPQCAWATPALARPAASTARLWGTPLGAATACTTCEWCGMRAGCWGHTCAPGPCPPALPGLKPLTRTSVPPPPLLCAATAAFGRRRRLTALRSRTTSSSSTATDPCAMQLMQLMQLLQHTPKAAPPILHHRVCRTGICCPGRCEASRRLCCRRAGHCLPS